MRRRHRTRIITILNGGAIYVELTDDARCLPIILPGRIGRALNRAFIQATDNALARIRIEITDDASNVSAGIRDFAVILNGEIRVCGFVGRPIRGGKGSRCADGIRGLTCDAAHVRTTRHAADGIVIHLVRLTVGTARDGSRGDTHNAAHVIGAADLTQVRMPGNVEITIPNVSAAVGIVGAFHVAGVNVVCKSDVGIATAAENAAHAVRVVASRARYLNGGGGMIRAVVNGNGVAVIDPTHDAARKVRARDVAGIPTIGNRVAGLQVSYNACRFTKAGTDDAVILAVFKVLTAAIQLAHDACHLPAGAARSGARDVASVPSVIDMLAAARGITADARDITGTACIGAVDRAVIDDSKRSIATPSVVGHRKRSIADGALGLAADAAYVLHARDVADRAVIDFARLPVDARGDRSGGLLTHDAAHVVAARDLAGIGAAGDGARSLAMTDDAANLHASALSGDVAAICTTRDIGGTAVPANASCQSTAVSCVAGGFHCAAITATADRGGRCRVADDAAALVCSGDFAGSMRTIADGAAVETSADAARLEGLTGDCAARGRGVNATAHPADDAACVFAGNGAYRAGALRFYGAARAHLTRAITDTAARVVRAADRAPALDVPNVGRIEGTLQISDVAAHVTSARRGNCGRVGATTALQR